MPRKLLWLQKFLYCKKLDRSHKTIKTFVYEEFNAIQEVRDHPRKFTTLPHVEPRKVFERDSSL